MAGTKFFQNFLAALTLIVFSTIQVTNAYECPDFYPFPSCPRRNNTDDRQEDTLCCQINGVYQCCSEDNLVLAAWAIVVVVISCLVVLGVLIALILCCCCGLTCTACACIKCLKPKENPHVVFNEPTIAFTGTTVYPAYGTGPPPPTDMAPPAYTPDSKGTKPV